MSDRLNIKAAVFVVLERDGKIFLLRRLNTGWADGMWTLPSGHIDPGQTAIEAIQVEAREEAVVEIAADDLEFIHSHYVFDAYANYYFKATKWEGEPKIGEPHLASEAGWFAYDEIPDDTIMHVRQMLADVAKGRYFGDMANDPYSNK